MMTADMMTAMEPAAAKRQTIDSYEEYAREYAAVTAVASRDIEERRAGFAADIGRGGRVLEIGSGSGRDALALEALGLSVRRTDITGAFVALLREAGHRADILDPLVDDLTDTERNQPYDGVYAMASLLHVRREDLPTVLRRLAEVTRPAGLIFLDLKEGDGDGFSEHGSIAAPRHFTYWRAEPLRRLVDEAGWRVREVSGSVGANGQSWLSLTALRDGDL